MAGSIGEKLTPVAAILTFGLGLTALFLGVERWWLIFVVGWFLVTPLFAVLFDGSGDAVGDAIEAEVERSIEKRVRDSISGGSTGASGAAGERTQNVDSEDALDLLRERYARGELDDVEFERKVERLLETESLEAAEVLFGRGDGKSPTDGSSGASTDEDGRRDTDDDREPATERS